MMENHNNSNSISNSLRNEYLSRINKVMDYIEKNLAKEFTLEELAEVANFSRFHFHRIFKGFLGETLFQFIQRLRLEKAADQLLKLPDKPISDIAYDFGFSSSAAFSRAFRDFFDLSATGWRELCTKSNSNLSEIKSKFSKINSNIRKEKFQSNFYIDIVTNNILQNIIWRIEMNDKQITTQVEVREIEAMNVAYIRHIGPYAGNEELFGMLFGKLMRWAGPRGLIRMPETKLLTIYHDNPDIVEDEKLRISVCMTVPSDTKTDGEIGKMEVPGGKYAVAKFEIFPTQYGDAWDMVYGGWLPQSGYQPDDRPCFELYLNDPKSHPEGKHVFEIYAPVKPM